MIYENLKNRDIEVYNAVNNELDRLNNNIELIASENAVSDSVLEAAGSILTNKYAEGYPAHRYYGGCVNVDVVETLAIERAKKLFNAEYANVQPHSGANANLAVFFALIKPGDTVLGMNLSEGGHLSHGSPVNISGKYFNIVSYGVESENQMIDYDNVRKIALECKPKLIIAGASAYSRLIDYKKFREIADEVGAYLMVDMAHIAGMVAAKLIPSPVEYADVVTTTTHKTLRGPRGGLILCKEELGKLIDKAVFPGVQGGPLMHIIAAKAVALGEALNDDFKDYQKQILVNANVLCNELIKKKINIVSGGTDNHLMLLDLTETGVSGKELEARLDSVNITANKNSIPGDKAGMFVTSGLRIGTPAVTTRGFKEAEMVKIAQWISDTVYDYENKKDIILSEVKELCSKYPLYR